MGTTQTIPAGGAGFSGPDSASAAGTAPISAGASSAASAAAQRTTSTAMVPLDSAPLENHTQDIDEELQPFSPMVARLPVELDVTVPVREFRVRNLLALQPGQLIESQWGHGDDVPLAAGGIALAWTEFEVIDDNQLAVRITRLS